MAPSETPPPDDTQQESLAQAGSSLLRLWRDIASDFLALATLELRLAGLSFAFMVALGVGAALLLVTAWLLLMGAIACWIVIPGSGWGVTLLVMALCNAGGIALLVWLIRARSRDLLFARTRRQLMPAPTQTPTGREP